MSINEIEVVARAICYAWGYLWDGDPDEDDQVVPEKCAAYEERPDKELFREAARRAIDAYRKENDDRW